MLAFITLLLVFLLSTVNSFKFNAARLGAGLAAASLAISPPAFVTGTAYNNPLNIPVAQAVAPTKSIFVGEYDDPNHPGCMRKISAEGKTVTILGSDNKDGSKQWKLTAKEDFPGTIFVDFSPKGIC